MVQRWSQIIWYLSAIPALMGAVFSPELPGVAQILPDNSLGVESSTVTPTNLIGGGARRGSNLFHSFREFNVGNSQQVYFANPAGVENILSRVTGKNPSNILGTLGVLGTANLFLLNPNGILFGPNARLDVRGSFVASTASSIRFANGLAFSAVNPTAPPLLTVSTPIGLQFNGGEGDIVVQAGQVPDANNPFTEDGDAGPLPGTAQTVSSTSEGRFNAISGRLDSARDVDLYQLFLTEGQPFTASTVNNTPINTELFLFDNNGLGIIANNDSIGFQSTLPLYQSFIPNRSGIYYLGISSYDINPRNLEGDMFDTDDNLVDSGTRSPLSGWDGVVGPSIRPNSGAYTITLNSRGEGLQVQPGRTLALIGGTVRFEGGTVQAPGGRVEIAGVAGAGRVGLEQTGQALRLRVPDQVARADVALTNNSLLNVRAGGGGSITIHARNLDVTTSSLLAGIAPGSGSAGSRAGNIEINTTEATHLNSSSVINDVGVGATGNAGNINLSTGSLAVTNGAGLYARTFGEGNAGNIAIQARDTVRFDYALAVSIVSPTGIGQGGDIRITADSVSATRIAQLVALSQGAGNAGNVIIHARNAVNFDGREGRIATAAFSSVGNRTPVGDGIVGNPNGQGGDIRITARSVSVTGGARLLANALGVGDAGNVIIHARDTVYFDGVLSSDGLFGGAYSNVAATGTGEGGDIVINTSVLELAGGAQLAAFTAGQGNAGNVLIHARDVVRFADGSGTFSNVLQTGRGNGGSINITSRSLQLSNGAALTVSSEGTGNAGSLTVQADVIELDHQGQIVANTVSGGGDINLRSPLLLLRRNSRITTNAAGTATGGNINIRANAIVAPLNENNDIIANAEQGSGGQITLTAEGIFGLDFRTREDLQQLLNPTNPLDPQRLSSNDVTAFSQANPRIDAGSVTVQTPNLDPTRGITEFSTDLTDPSQLIATTCAADQGSSFTMTGRGGLPEDPRQPLMGQVIWQDERGTGGEEVTEGTAEGAIAEAQGWVVNGDGTVALVAQQPLTQRSGAFGQTLCALLNP